MRGKVNTYVLLCAVGILMLGSCTKEPIQIIEPNEPVFMLNGVLSGVEFDLIAGDDNAFMHTSTKTINGVTLFTGELSDDNFSLELGIFDGLLDRPGHVTVDEIENITPTFARRSNEPLIILMKSRLGNEQNIASVEWYVNNSLVGSENVPIYEPGKYKVCAQITFNDQSTDRLCDDIIVGYDRAANCSIEYDLEQGFLNANILAVDAAVTSVDWFIDDNQIGSGGVDLSQYSLGQLEKFKLKAKVYFDNGVVRTKTVLVDALNNTNYSKDFSNIEMSSAYVAPDQDFNIRLKIQANGSTYLSEYADNENSSLTITGVEYYGKNDENNDVYKVSGIVDAVVMELGTEKMISLSFSTVFGVEIH